MDVYTKWAFERGKGLLEKVLLAELLDVCNDDFYVSGSELQPILKRHFNSYEKLRLLHDKGLIRIKKTKHLIDYVKILYP